jgi:hypothetical protein
MQEGNPTKSQELMKTHIDSTYCQSFSLVQNLDKDTEVNKNFSNILMDLSEISESPKSITLPLETEEVAGMHLLHNRENADILTAQSAFAKQLKFSLISLAVLAAVLGFVRYKSSLIDMLIDIFESIREFQEPYKSSLFFVVSFTIQAAGVPISSLVAVIIAYCYSSMLTSYLLSLSACLLANLTICWFFSRNPVSATAQNREALGFADFLVATINKVFDNYPMAACFLVRTMHMPDYAKLYILSRYSLTWLQFMMPLLCVESLNIFLYTFIGLQMKSKFDLISPKSFSEKSTPEKISSILMGTLVCMQLIVLIGGITYTYSRYRDYRKAKLTDQNRELLGPQTREL